MHVLISNLAFALSCPFPCLSPPQAAIPRPALLPATSLMGSPLPPLLCSELPYLALAYVPAVCPAFGLSLVAGLLSYSVTQLLTCGALLCGAQQVHT
jgi:hypothetical protein